MKLLRRFLGFIGFMYCSTCGSKLVFSRNKGYYEEIYKCPVCGDEK